MYWQVCSFLPEKSWCIGFQCWRNMLTSPMRKCLASMWSYGFDTFCLIPLEPFSDFECCMHVSSWGLKALKAEKTSKLTYLERGQKWQPICLSQYRCILMKYKPIRDKPFNSALLLLIISTYIFFLFLISQAFQVPEFDLVSASCNPCTSRAQTGEVRNSQLLWYADEERAVCACE